MKQVAIIGAGMAGLSAAKVLTERGIRCVLFEKSRGPGGRMASKRADELSFDLGAQYFTAQTPQFNAAVTGWQDNGWVSLWPGAFYSLGTDGSLRELKQQPQRFVGVPRMSALTRALSQPFEVVAQTRVGHVLPKNDVIELYSDHDDSLGSFDALICTAPPEQSNDLLGHLGLFDTLFAQAAMAPCWVVGMTLAAPLDLPYDGLFVNQGPLSWLANNAAKPDRTGPPCWTVHASEAWSNNRVDADKTWVTEHLIKAFAEATGTLPEVQQTHCHRWLYARTESQWQQGYAWNPQQRIGLCSDWLHGGRVEGAYLSATKLANAMINTDA